MALALGIAKRFTRPTARGGASQTAGKASVQPAAQPRRIPLGDPGAQVGAPENSPLAAAYLAPRTLGKGITPSDLGSTDGHWPAPGIDTCTFSPMDGTRLRDAAARADYVAILDIDYNFALQGVIKLDESGATSTGLTPLVVRRTEDVLVDHLSMGFASIRLPGKCTRDGLCKLDRCPRFVWSGRALVLARRFCAAPRELGTILLVSDVYPLEGDRLYDYDGSELSSSSVLSQIARNVSPQDTCPG